MRGPAAGLALAALLAGAGASPAPATPASLVPAGFKLLGQAAGDLDGDRRPDLVVVVGSLKEGTGEPSEWASHPRRRLIAARRLADGKLQVMATSDRAVMCEHCGGVFGEPFEGLKIEAGELVVSHYGGSRNRWSYQDRYRWQGGVFQHTVASSTASDTLEPGFLRVRRDDLQTRLVTITTGEGKRAKVQAFAEVWAPRGVAGAFKGPVTAVAKAAHVTAGRSAWRDADDASFLVAATREGGTLHLRVQVSDDKVTQADQVQLIDGAGKPVKPLASQRVARPRGYDWVARYPLPALGLAATEQRYKDYHEGQANPAGDRVLNASVEVHDGDAAGAPVTILSTSQGGRKWPGNLRLRAEARTPRLGDYDRVEGEQELTDPRSEN